ncbi:phage tail tape measure protein [Leisingera sp. HS039]|uniref:phage tail tape measure protein n=1 Tax=Leisingera sp. HS039 TaxID=2818496 RepID=UPI001B3A0EE4|nr:phage tail tape measure protein [Leisingera sp. HS039]MBQ4826546.1 phage tail tape measure protein [Leisingera sp. HS039]
MATKRIETQLTIKAIDRYSGMLKNMRTVTGRFADGVRSEMGRLQGIRGSLKLIEDFNTLRNKAKASGEAMEQAREKVRRLELQFKNTKAPTQKMYRELERARGAADQLAESHRRNRRALDASFNGLRQAGVSTADLAGEQRRLSGALDGASASFGRQMERMRRLEAMQTRIAEARERMDKSLATAANLSFVGNASMQTGRRILTGIANPVQQAVEFETAMSDVRKVVDFDTPQSFRRMSDDILTLSTRIPMAAEGLAQIVAAGGQSGIAREDLTRFAEMAAKIGVAFDISAEQSGDSMANIKTALGLTLDETGLLFDAMNHLSNKMASTAPKVLDFTNRVAVDGAVKGFSPTETMAFGSAMIAAGAGADVAATSFRNMGKALARGEGATDRQSAAYQKLGLDAEAVARAMQEDAVGTTIDVMRRINELPKHLQSSVTSDLFGDEARALAPLINNLDLLRDALGLVSEERKFQGSAEAEYAARAETTANNLQLMRNQMTRLGISVGEIVLPHLNDLLEVSQGMIDRIVEWTKEHPKLTKWLVIGAAAVGAMAVAGGALLTAGAGLIGTMAVLRFGLAGFGARALFAAGDVAGLARGVRGLSGLDPTFGRPRLGGHLSDFADFRRGAVGHIDAVQRRHDIAMQRIARQRRKMLIGGALAAGLTYLAMRNVPENPEDLGAFQEENKRRMNDAFRATPGISHLMDGYEWMFKRVHGKPPPVEPALLPDDPAIRSAAATVHEYAGGDGLPTAERLKNLREDVAAYRAEVEAAQAALDAAPEFASGITNPLRVQAQADLDRAEADLARAQESLKGAETAAGELSKALQVLDGANVTPEISTDSIDRALDKVRELSGRLRAMPSAATGETPELKPAGARAFGGPVRAGLPYLVNEHTPRSEWFVPSASGGVLNVAQAQSAFRSHLSAMGPRPLSRLQSGARGLRAAGVAVLATSALAAPAAAQAVPGAGGAKGDVSVHIHGNITIPVPQGVTDPEAIAELAADKLGQRVMSTVAASFSD